VPLWLKPGLIGSARGCGTHQHPFERDRFHFRHFSDQQHRRRHHHRNIHDCNLRPGQGFKSEEGSVTADAAVATSIVDASAAVRVTGTTLFDVDGALSLSASNTRTVTTTADGSAGGATAAGGSVAVAVVTGDTEAYLGERAPR
jgi:hypothetical protein